MVVSVSSTCDSNTMLVVMCSFECFQERQVHFDQDLQPLIATSRLGILDWDL